MDLSTLTMDKDEARRRFLEYRNSVRQRHNAEDEQIMRGYRALSRGHQVIDICATLRKGGWMLLPPRWHKSQPVWVPRLALMRADQEWCWLNTYQDGRVEFHHTGNPRPNERRNYFRFSNLFTPPPDVDRSWWNFKAMVPPVPPALRPHDSIGNYHILWEAEWQRVPPKDPALLKHIGGDLYVVLATWELTELERTVLAGRFTR